MSFRSWRRANESSVVVRDESSDAGIIPANERDEVFGRTVGNDGFDRFSEHYEQTTESSLVFSFRTGRLSRGFYISYARGAFLFLRRFYRHGKRLFAPAGILARGRVDNVYVRLPPPPSNYTPVKTKKRVPVCRSGMSTALWPSCTRRDESAAIRFTSLLSLLPVARPRCIIIIIVVAHRPSVVFDFRVTAIILLRAARRPSSRNVNSCAYY